MLKTVFQWTKKKKVRRNRNSHRKAKITSTWMSEDKNPCSCTVSNKSYCLYSIIRQIYLGDLSLFISLTWHLTRAWLIRWLLSFKNHLVRVSRRSSGLKAVVWCARTWLELPRLLVKNIFFFFYHKERLKNSPEGRLEKYPVVSRLQMLKHSPKLTHVLTGLAALSPVTSPTSPPACIMGRSQTCNVTKYCRNVNTVCSPPQLLLHRILSVSHLHAGR